MDPYSDDDFDPHDSCNGESDADDAVSGDTNGESDDQVPDSDDDQSSKNSRCKKGYRIWKEEDIKQKQDDDIAILSSTLSLPRVSACMLLHYYKWNIDDAQEAWFNDEDKVRKAVGLLEKPLVEIPTDKDQVCGICFEIYLPAIRLKSCVNFCGHYYCTLCLGTYVSTAINDGLGCLSLRCPTPSCGAAIGEEMVYLLVLEEDRKKYGRYLFRSCIEENVKTKWCPAPNCDYAVEYEVGSESYDVYCDCSCGFCWNCNEDAHSPVDCDTVAKWILKNISESESVTWLLANSKSCPKCKVAIEKNRGCMHMTCKKPCGYEFCWLCLGPWKEHNGNTGGFHTCNKYQKSKKLSKEEKTREMAKQYLERYTHYYERWAANDRSRGKAKKDLLAIKTGRLQKLEEKLEGSSNRLEFVEKAWLQIIECRSVLKWTYAYGYYLPEHEIFKKQMFEFLQEKAEAALERLHEYAEIELRKFIEKVNDEDKEFDKDEFIVSYRMKLTDLTRITRNYFGNLVRALENGLSDVASSKASD